MYGKFKKLYNFQIMENPQKQHQKMLTSIVPYLHNPTQNPLNSYNALNPHNPHPQNLLSSLIHYSLSKNNLLTKYSAKYIAQALSIHQLQQFSQLFSNNASMITLAEFVGVFGSAIAHSREETLFLILSLIDIYGEIKRKSRHAYDGDGIEYSLIIDYLCEKIVNYEENVQVQLRFCENSSQVQQKSEKKAPRIRHLFTEAVPYLCHQETKQKTLKNTVNGITYCPQIDRIFVLASFSTKIQIFTTDLKLKGTIAPKLGHCHKNQPIINSYAYSASEQRIGCIVHSTGLIFWEIGDNFETEKTIEGVKADRIFFLDCFQVWVTLKANIITVWDIQHERQHYHLCIGEATQICSLQQLKKIDSIILSVTLKTGKKQLQIHHLSPQKSRLLTKLELDPSGCHTLHCNPGTDTLLQLSFSNSVRVWQYDNLTFELMPAGKLIGHRSIVVAVESVGKSSVVVTGDDRGWVRMWDLRGARCLQTVRIGVKEVRQLLCFGDKLVIGDNRLSVLTIDNRRQDKTANSCIYLSYDNNQQKIYLFTSTSCNIICQKTGQLLEIFRICQLPQQQLLCAQRLKNSFCLGTNRGHLLLIDKNFTRRKTIKVYQGSGSSAEISILKSDQGGNWLLSVSTDGVMGLWVADQCEEGLQRCKSLAGMAGIGTGGDGIAVEVSSDNCFIGLGVREKEIQIVDFQSFKQIERLAFNNKINCYKFHPIYNILITCLQNNKIYLTFYSKQKNKQKFVLQTIIQTHLTKYQLFTTQHLHRPSQKSHHHPHYNNLYQQQQKQQPYSQIQQQKTQTIITTILVNRYGQLLCLQKSRTISLYDLGALLESIGDRLVGGIGRSQLKGRSQANLLRPALEKFQISNKQTNCNEYFSEDINQNIQNLMLVKQKYVQNCREIATLTQNSGNGTLMILSTDGTISLHHDRTLQCLGLRKNNQLGSQFWTECTINQQILKKKIIQAIRLNQRIHKQPFRPQIQSQIILNRLDIESFLSQLAHSTQNTPNQSNLNHRNPCLKNKTKHTKHHSVFQPSSISLKNMQTEKRLRKASCVQDHQPTYKAMALSRKLNQSIKIANNSENPLRDTYFFLPTNQRLSLNKDRQDECQLFDQINQKFQKWKIQKKSKSLSLLNTGLTFKLTTNKNTQKNIKFVNKQKTKENQRGADLKQNLKQKILNVFGRKDKRLDLIRKIFKKQFKEIVKKKI